MKKSPVDPLVFAEFVRKYHTASKKEKATLRDKFRRDTGISDQLIYKMLREVKKGTLGIKDVALREKKRTRTTPEKEAKKREIALTINAIKRQSTPKDGQYFFPTELAAERAVSMGLIDPKDLPSRSTLDRWQASLGVNKKSQGKKVAARRLKAGFPGQVLAVDATTMSHYYLRLDGEIAHRPDINPFDKNHFWDILEREKLSRIWVYYAVDMFSKAFLCMPFAPQPKGEGSKNGGENADDTWEFLRFCMLSKQELSPIQTYDEIERLHHPLFNCPIEGLPTILFCDKGSAIGGSRLINNAIHRLGGTIRTHFPGNASAKGLVESRIGAFKRSVESGLDRKFIRTINDLRYFYFTWSNYLNTKNGAYDRWREGCKGNKIVRVSEQNLRDAQVTSTIRSIDGYGCVSINKVPYFVGELYSREKCFVWKLPGIEGSTDRFIAETQDMKYHFLTPSDGVSHDFADKRVRREKSEREQNNEVAQELSANIRKLMVFEDTLPPDIDRSNIIHLRSPGTDLQTESPFVPERLESVTSAWKYLEHRTGIDKDLSPTGLVALVNQTLETIFSSVGEIPGDRIEHIAGIVEDHFRNQIQNKQERKNQ